MKLHLHLHFCFPKFRVWPHEGSHVSQVKPIAHLLITVPDDGQIEELTAMLLGKDGVNTCSMWPSQLLIYCQIIRWWHMRPLVSVQPERKLGITVM